MSRVFLLFALLAVLLLLPASSQTPTFCQTYSNTTTNATAQINLLTTIVVRAAVGGTFVTGGTTYTIPGLFSSTGPLYSIFTGQVQYRVGAPNYVTDMPSGSQAALVGHLVGYFGALFGCTASGYTPVNNPNMYAVHANMSINNAMETYFITQLANTLLSLGVNASDVTNVAAPALSLFNRCGAPISAISSTAPVQVCGTSDCPLATGATQSTCTQYYPNSASGGVVGSSGQGGIVTSSSSSSSSSSTGSNDAASKYATSALSVVAAAVVAALAL